MKRYLCDLEEQVYQLKCGANLLNALRIAMTEGHCTADSFTDALFAACLFLDNTQEAIENTLNKAFEEEKTA